MKQSFLIGCCLFTITLNAQFVEILNTPFEGVNIGDVEYADVDNDGDNDVFITGVNASGTYISKLYTNNGTGSFVEALGINFIPVIAGSAAFGDVDNDNDPDLMLSGFTNVGRTTRMYLNDGAGNFSEDLVNSFDGFSHGSTEFFDIDSDGDLDVLFTGINSSMNDDDTKLYLNDGTGVFTLQTGAPFEGVDMSDIAIGDVDADNDLDVIITGHSDITGSQVKLYLNDGAGVFALDNTQSFTIMSGGAVELTDVDGDNDLDLIACGGSVNTPTYGPFLQLYLNDGSGNYTLVPGAPFPGLNGLIYSEIKVADFDKDNDIDVLFSGDTIPSSSSDSPITMLFENDGSGNFSEITTPFADVMSPGNEFFDIDGDNDEDLIITGWGSVGGRVAHLYENQTCAPKTSIDTVVACNSYTWSNGVTYSTSSDTIEQVFTDPMGCDSVVRLHLSVYPGTNPTDVVSACGSYTWVDGVTYTSSNNTATYSGVGGCTVSLDLTINNDVTGVDTRSACNTYTWIDGLTYYTDNNTATHLISGGASTGCDSLVTLDLTIMEDALGFDLRYECDSLTWLDGNTYYTSNNTATYTFVGGAANGCDSAVVLELTIVEPDVSITQNDSALVASPFMTSFQWLDCDNNWAPIAGEIDNEFIPTINGNYAVQVTENTCVDTSACVNFDWLSISALEQKPIFFSPNPSEDQFILNNSRAIRIEVYNAIGEQVLIAFNTDRISLGDVPSGIYFAHVVLGEERYISRLIKE